MKKVILSFFLVAAMLCIGLCGCGTKEPDPTGISLEEFNKIKTGMTYFEVKDIVGGEGTKVSESKNDTDDYIEYVTIYKFNGETNGSAEFTFTKRSYKDILKLKFEAAELTNKTQSDLS